VPINIYRASFCCRISSDLYRLFILGVHHYKVCKGDSTITDSRNYRKKLSICHFYIIWLVQLPVTLDIRTTTLSSLYDLAKFFVVVWHRFLDLCLFSSGNALPVGVNGIISSNFSSIIWRTKKVSKRPLAIDCSVSPCFRPTIGVFCNNVTLLCFLFFSRCSR